MKNINKKTLAAMATFALLSAGVVNAGPYGYGYPQVKIGYDNSFNRTNQIDATVDNSQRVDSRSKLKYDIDNSVSNRFNHSYQLNKSFNYRADQLNAGQALNQKRNYLSNVGQNAANQGSATGHSMAQQQGSTGVGSLVSTTSSAKHKGHSIASPTISRQYGSVNTGNMLGSQIGAVQTGMQGGGVTNLQGNDQAQTATSFVGSDDQVSNSATK
ncbi:hypothetical protein [Motiliproteus sp.]|uniref:hypothetical protein n=1 Tax=Motiliproteus sp. TaxID=1898955 RepID=UPI003BA92DCC